MRIQVYRLFQLFISKTKHLYIKKESRSENLSDNAYLHLWQRGHKSQKEEEKKQKEAEAKHRISFLPCKKSLLLSLCFKKTKKIQNMNPITKERAIEGKRNQVDWRSGFL
jgi:hypothetical protein